MSSADHDVNLDGVASLTWDGTIGTGGVVDRWERNIGQQEIHIPIGSECTGGYCVEYEIHNHGPSEGTMIRFSVEGVALVPGRTVEIGWADGTVWTENASVEVTNFRTAWNLGSTMSGAGIFSASRKGGFGLPIPIGCLKNLNLISHEPSTSTKNLATTPASSFWIQTSRSQKRGRFQK